MRFEEKVVLVTGGARGIGAAICRAFAREGAYVVVADIDLKVAQKTAASLDHQKNQHLPVRVDLAHKSQILKMVEIVIKEFSMIHILVNNAGICPLTGFEDISEAEWDQVLNINLKSAFLCCQNVLPYMKPTHRGRIINISSAAGKMGGVLVGAHYAASKAGLLALTWCLARAYAQYGITANAVAPATVETDMTRAWGQAKLKQLRKRFPLGRIGKPDDVASAVLFLASDEADFITGEVLDVNGGFLMD